MFQGVEDTEGLFTMKYATGNRRTTWNRECEEYIRGKVFKI